MPLRKGGQYGPMAKLRTFAIALCTACALSACGGAATRSLSPGAELIDLKASLDSGQLRGDEYDRAKRRVLERGPSQDAAIPPAQQLADLQRALDAGAINREEYDRLHRALTYR